MMQKIHPLPTVNQGIQNIDGLFALINQLQMNLAKTQAELAKLTQFFTISGENDSMLALKVKKQFTLLVGHCTLECHENGKILVKSKEQLFLESREVHVN